MSTVYPTTSSSSTNSFSTAALPTLNIHTVFYSTLVASFLYLCATSLYQLFFSPLASIPGPWYAAISDFWLTTHVARLQQCMTVDALFDRYGPVVRVGPNKVAFRDLTTARSVYCVNKFDKSPFYKALLTNNHDHAMTTLPTAEHAARRKTWAPHYSLAHLTKFQPEIADSVINLVQILDRKGGNASVSCLDLFRHLMVDIISVSVFGSRPGALDHWAGGVHDVLAMAVNDFPTRGIVRSFIPNWAWELVCRFPNATWRRICSSDINMATFVRGHLDRIAAKMHAGTEVEDKTSKIPLIERMLQQRITATQEPLAEQTIVSECMGHIVAGVDTTSTSLSYFCWELTRRKEILRRLQEELDEHMYDRHAVPDFATLCKLPYLNAFIKEGMRVYGPAPSLLERVVPSTTASKIDDSFDMMGYALPPGTTVATQAWSMHRDPEVFPSPETFLPERWLVVEGVKGEDERLSRMSQYLMPFGIGNRVCGGQNLAQIVLRVALAAVVANFDISANREETNEKTMQIKDAFVIHPATKECKLVFTPRKY
ncbi:cytochrome P450 [Epithele typhae]|uniref:cytochrome P450 n=1 Tax=Epithele typhae TaxID=378194 RepID=UPI002008D906|nr:cytochrome P450 [Epithele typhae]KAH9939286.1 cytochrome P450 [Epithele typhae]